MGTLAYSPTIVGVSSALRGHMPSPRRSQGHRGAACPEPAAGWLRLVIMASIPLPDGGIHWPIALPILSRTVRSSLLVRGRNRKPETTFSKVVSISFNDANAWPPRRTRAMKTVL
jgi:hypothetical protein